MNFDEAKERAESFAKNENMRPIPQVSRMVGIALLAKIEELEKSLLLVRAETKEECAKMCECGIDQLREDGRIDAANELERCAAAIRALK